MAIDSIVSFASAARADGSIVLAGWTDGDWEGELVGTLDFAALALDEDGAELWRWQVRNACGRPWPACGATRRSNEAPPVDAGGRGS